MKKLISELVGTFVLVFIGCGSVLVGNDLLTTALAFGLSFLIMEYIIGPVSGCHINPAVTLAMYLNDRIKGSTAFLYGIFQILGAILGGAVLYLISSSTSFGDNIGANLMNGDKGISIPLALVMEIVLTFIFVSVVIGATGKKGNHKLSGLIIGLALVAVHIVGISYTGTSVNPARSIGPALFSGSAALKELPIFIIAPLIGAVLGAAFCKFVLGSELDTDSLEVNEEAIEISDQVDDSVETVDTVEEN